MVYGIESRQRVNKVSERDMPFHHGVEVSPRGEYLNETVKLLFERRSCRSYSDRDVPEDMLRVVLEAGIHESTGGTCSLISSLRSGMVRRGAGSLRRLARC